MNPPLRERKDRVLAMKQKYTITVADMTLCIVSDAAPDEVESIAALLDRRMKDISAKSPRCTKSEAAILSALSYCSERNAMQEAFKKVEKDAFRYAGENERLKKTIERMQEELDNLRRDAQVMRAVLDRATSDKEKAVPKPIKRESPKKITREATQLSAFDTLPEEEPVHLTAPVPPIVTKKEEDRPSDAPVKEQAAPADSSQKEPKKSKKTAKTKSHIGGMFDLLTFSDV